MATLISKTYKGKKAWYIVENVTIEGKLKRQYLENLGHISKSEAKLKLANYQTLNRGRGLARISFFQAAHEFHEHYKGLVGQNITPGTLSMFSLHLEVINEVFGHIELKKLSFENVEAFKLKLKGTGCSNRYINMHLTDLKKILEYSIKRGWLFAYPKIQRLSETKPDYQVDCLSRKEIETLLKYANMDQATYLCLMIYTGMRPQEASNLRWEHVNLEDGAIDVISTNRLKPGRRIPIHSKLKEVLQTYDTVSEYVSPYRTTGYAMKAMTRLEKHIEKKTKGTMKIKCNPYKLRKTFGSILAQSGLDTIVVAKLMGHARLETTYKYYIRLKDENLRLGIEKL